MQYINGVVEKNIPLMREYVDNIKTIDDAINEATIEMQSDKESYK